MRGISEKRLREIKEEYKHPIFQYLFDECKELNEWKPIDTAPKDKWVLLHYPELGTHEGYWINGDWYCDMWELTGCSDIPTHWQELPEDPK